jgi:hypothetical protein
MLMARWLTDRGYSWDFEPADWGVPTCPDFRVQLTNGNAAIEVKAFETSGMFSDPLAAGAANRTMKRALKPIRNQIAEAAPQLKPLANSGMPLVVALANPLNRPVPSEASMVIAAMYGDPAYTFPADGGPGRFTLGLNGKLTNDHPYISAVIVLRPDVRGIELASGWFDQNRASFSTPEEMIAEYRRLERSGAFDSDNTVAIDLIETAGTATRLPENFANGPDDTCWRPIPDGTGMMRVK